MAHDGEAGQAQRVGDPARVAGRRGQGAAGLGGGAAVARAVVGDPAQAEAVVEERLRRRADVGRAVVPQDRQAVGGARSRVVDVQDPAVTDREFEFLRHRTSLAAAGTAFDGIPS
ncbi:hypothetical protein GCM10020220_062870 [Nonomuraea rubra]